MKTYTGYRTPDGDVVKVHEEGKEPRLFDPRFDLRNHSPMGQSYFENQAGEVGQCGGIVNSSVCAELMQRLRKEKG